MKPKSLLAALLLLHVLAHPAVHTLVPGFGKAPAIQSSTEDERSTERFSSLGPCVGCQTCSSLLVPQTVVSAAPPPTLTERISIGVSFYVSGEFDRTFSARAPPLA